eukprot:12924543-Prorocentrum_lima.AAC.1
MAGVDTTLLELHTNMYNMKMGMEFVIEQVEQLEQNLQIDPAHNPPSHPQTVYHPQPPPMHEQELPGAR